MKKIKEQVWKNQLLKDFLRHTACPHHSTCCSLSASLRHSLDIESKNRSDPQFLSLCGLFSVTEVFIAIKGWFESVRVAGKLVHVREKERVRCVNFFVGLLAGLDPKKASVTQSSEPPLFPSESLSISGWSTTMGP